MTKGKYVAQKDDFNMADWTLDTFEEMSGEMIEEHWKPLLLKALGELLEIVSKEKVHAYLPIMWSDGKNPQDGIGGPPVDDPLLIYVELPIAGDEYDGPIWSFNFRDLVTYWVEGIEAGDVRGGYIAPKDKAHLRKLRDGLAALVEEMDAILARPKPAKEKT